MPAILGALLALIVVAVLLQPLFMKQRSQPAQSKRAPDELRAERRSMYREISNLRNDFESGHITKSEFDRLTNQLRRNAAAALRDEDQSRADAISTEIEIEAEVQKLRSLPERDD